MKEATHVIVDSIPNEAIHVIVDTTPSDDLSLFLNIMSGFVVPLLIFGATVYLSKQYREADQRRSFLDNIHSAINNLYQSTQSLRLNNLKRKKHEEWASPVADINKTVIESSSVEAISMQQDLMKWHLDKILVLETESGQKVIDLASAQSRLQHLLSEEETSTLDSILSEIRKSSSKAGMITEKMMEDFVQEINSLMTKVETHPEKWIKK